MGELLISAATLRGHNNKNQINSVNMYFGATNINQNTSSLDQAEATPQQPWQAQAAGTPVPGFVPHLHGALVGKPARPPHLADQPHLYQPLQQTMHQYPGDGTSEDAGDANQRFKDNQAPLRDSPNRRAIKIS